MEYEEEQPKPLPKPNPVTQAAHRREVLRQVTWPLIIGLLLIVTAIVLLVRYQVGTIETWSQIATIFVILPLLVLGLLLLVVLAAVAFGLGQLLHYLPPYARLTQDAIEKVGQQVQSGAQVSMKPVRTIQGFVATISKFFKRNNSGNY